MEQDRATRPGGARIYLFTTSTGTTEELSTAEVSQKRLEVICNPFLAEFWPQDPENMTLLPVKDACNLPRTHSWRRMQLTSPPIKSLSMNLWYIPPFEPSLPNIQVCKSLTPPQVHQTRQLRLTTPAIHRPRAHGRDSRALS
jgi:hypothetical protein